MISFVVPLFNEAESLPALHQELGRSCDAAGLGEVEFIFVDDGSRDGSWAVIEGLVRRDPRARAIRFRRNSGKAAALTAGFRAVRGEIVFTLDADLQDDPAEVPRFLAKLDKGFDLVSGWKRSRHDPWHKVFPSRVFNWMISSVTGCRLHDHNCGFKAYRRAVLGEVKLYGERHRFVPVLAAARGFRVAEIEVHHRARPFGRSKYGFERFLKGFLDLITVQFLTRFGARPMHVLGGAGLALGTLGLILLLGVLVLGGQPIAGLLAVVCLVLGGQLVGLGLLAELIVSRDIRPDESYSIMERLGVAEAAPPDGDLSHPLP